MDDGHMRSPTSWNPPIPETRTYPAVANVQWSIIGRRVLRRGEDSRESRDGRRRVIKKHEVRIPINRGGEHRPCRSEILSQHEAERVCLRGQRQSMKESSALVKIGCHGGRKRLEIRNSNWRKNTSAFHSRPTGRAVGHQQTPIHTRAKAPMREVSVDWSHAGKGRSKKNHTQTFLPW